MKLGMNRDNQKRINRGMILKLIATGKCSSRIGLSKATGLTKTAITQIVSELISQKYLIETEKTSTAEIGRNPIGLAISPDSPHFAAVLIQRKFCEAAVIDMQMNILKYERIDREWETNDELMEAVYGLLDKVIAGDDRISGIGAASIGPVDVNEGKMLKPLYFHEIGELPLKELLSERYGLPVAFDHDNQSAALAEHFFGCGKGYDNILLIGIARGVGCGVLVNGQRIQSFRGAAPEIGHVSVDINGKQCICGNVGCLEMYVNTDFLLEEFRSETGLMLSYREFCDMTEDPRIDRVVKRALRKLDSAIINTLNILNSQLIILSEDCCAWQDRYVEMMEEDINRRKFNDRNERIPVRKAGFMEKALIAGAGANILNEVFRGDLWPEEAAQKKQEN